MRHIYYFTSYVILLCSFCLSCDNDDKTVGQEEFNTFVNGKYFDSIDAGIWLRQTEVGLQEINDQLDGTGPVITGMFWFTDGNTLLTRRLSTSLRSWRPASISNGGNIYMREGKRSPYSSARITGTTR